MSINFGSFPTSPSLLSQLIKGGSSGSTPTVTPPSRSLTSSPVFFQPSSSQNLFLASEKRHIETQLEKGKITSRDAKVRLNRLA